MIKYKHEKNQIDFYKEKIMTRKKFIGLQGATCKNWSWSWSFINKSKKFIIFGIWNFNDSENKGLILSEDWEKSHKGRHQPGYSQAIEHIKLIEKDNYQLKTFLIEHSSANNQENSSAKIKSFTKKLSNKKLVRVKNEWYACS